MVYFLKVIESITGNCLPAAILSITGISSERIYIQFIFKPIENPAPILLNRNCLI